MPTTTKKQPNSAPAQARGPKGTTYRLMDPWAPAERRSNRQRNDFPHEHMCGYCGATHYRHRLTRPAATLFCSAECMRLYKQRLIQPRHQYQRLAAAALAPKDQRPKYVISPVILSLLNSNSSFRTSNWRSA